MLVRVEGIWSQNMADSTTEGAESGGTSGLAVRIGTHIISIVQGAKIPRCNLVFSILFGVPSQKEKSVFGIYHPYSRETSIQHKHKHGNIFHLTNNNSENSCSSQNRTVGLTRVNKGIFLILKILDASYLSNN